MKLIWSGPALRDIDEIMAKYQRISPVLADEIMARIDAAPEPLLDFPEMAPTFGPRKARKWPIHDTPYYLVYKVNRGQIEITRIEHERGNWRSDP